MNLEIIFLPLVILLGVLTSYTDIKQGKILNLHIIFFVGVALLTYGFLLISGEVFGAGYFWKLLLNILIAFSVGFVFWNFGLWSAADSKLFAVYSAVIPLTVYSATYYDWFPSLTLLINSFVPFFVGFSVKGFFGSRNKVQDFRSVFNILELFTLLLLLFFILWIPSLVFLAFSWKMNYVLSVGLMIILGIVLNKVFGKRILWFLVLVSLLRVIFDFKTVFSTSFLLHFLVVYAVILVVFLLVKFNALFFSKSVRVFDLHRGDILSGQVRLIKSAGLVKLEQPAEGLTEADVRLLRRLAKAKKISPEVRILQTIPFAPFLFVGALITLILNGDFLIVLFNLLK
jgi:preflagellin peptidase FlaK